MPEQAEWLDGNVHRRHEVYARAAQQAAAGVSKTQPVYDCRILSDKVAEIEKRLVALETASFARPDVAHVNLEQLTGVQIHT